MTVVPAHARPSRPSTRPEVEFELIVPAFGARERLPATVAAALRFLARRPWSAAVVVVDDGVDAAPDCLDRFAASALGRAVGLEVIGGGDQGKGAAVRQGIATSSARFVGLADPDDAPPVETLDPVIELLRAGHGAVIASRHAAGRARADVERRTARRDGGAAFRGLVPLRLPDLADLRCGFMCFPGPLAREIVGDCHIDGFAFDVELLAHVVKSGHDVVRVPVEWTEGPTSAARRDGLRSLAGLLRVPSAG
ncbi:glycosyltransferase [Streptomyces sp. NPDC127092]|uniref:glycosyltransferase n=1 Tax=Streptomyces sp. NPDC127092 TaxID=3347135 RepID=UPI00365DE01E